MMNWWNIIKQAGGIMSSGSASAGTESEKSYSGDWGKNKQFREGQAKQRLAGGAFFSAGGPVQLRIWPCSVSLPAALAVMRTGWNSMYHRVSSAQELPSPMERRPPTSPGMGAPRYRRPSWMSL